MSRSGAQTLVGIPRLARQARYWSRGLLRRLSVVQRLLIGAFLVVALSMSVLGLWIGDYLRDAIVRGVAATAAASIDSLISFQMGGLSSEDSMSLDDRTRMSEVFAIGNDTDATRLLQIRIRRLDGVVLYESTEDLIEAEEAGPFLDAAGQGKMTAVVRDMEIAPVGPVGGHRIAVLKIYAPTHRQGTGEVIGVAELYFSAQSVLRLEAEARLTVWLLVGAIGAGASLLLALLISQTSRTVARQRRHLASNLSASRKLADENMALHAASERLRLVANSANENLLAQVGSDIHDGPVQLLTLIILRLTGRKGTATATTNDDDNSSLQLATDALEDLRNISSGLVLPGLEKLDPAAALRLAVRRHEELTGTRVRQLIESMPDAMPTAVKICAYRVIQEGLNNAYRHGGGDSQAVHATALEGELRIEITNAAKPAITSKADEEPGLVLRGMRFRVEALGGRLVIDVGAPPLSRLVATIPYIVSGGSGTP
jgi:signal transduction histidine kinase